MEHIVNCMASRRKTRTKNPLADWVSQKKRVIKERDIREHLQSVSDIRRVEQQAGQVSDGDRSLRDERAT